MLCLKYFNSHAHVERDLVKNFYSAVRNISTHTLTWSVTFLPKRHINHVFISTHTLTWSVTPQINELGLLMFISTHTLTWSVTFK